MGDRSVFCYLLVLAAGACSVLPLPEQYAQVWFVEGLTVFLLLSTMSMFHN